MNKKELMPKIEELVDDLLSGKQHLSHSSFGSFLRSPAHFIEYKFGQRITTDAFKTGNLVDTLLLEPTKFEERYVLYNKEDVLPEPNRSMNLGVNKVAKAEFLELHKGKTIIEQSEYDEAKDIINSVNGVSSAKGLLDMCDVHQEWLDFEWQGFRWKGAKDASCDELTIDLKTTQDASYYGFKRSITKYGYHRQAAIYNVSDGNINKPYFIIAVEKKKPYAVGVHHLQQQIIEKGLDQIERGLESFRECLIDESLFLQSYEFWAKKNHGIFEVAA